MSTWYSWYGVMGFLASWKRLKSTGKVQEYCMEEDLGGLVALLYKIWPTVSWLIALDTTHKSRISHDWKLQDFPFGHELLVKDLVLIKLHNTSGRSISDAITWVFFPSIFKVVLISGCASHISLHSLTTCSLASRWYYYLVSICAILKNWWRKLIDMFGWTS